MKFKNSDVRFFREAMREAEKSDFPRFHVGCVVTYKGHVISAAHNSEKTDPLQKEYNRYRHFKYQNHSEVRHSLHAEIKALKSIPYPVREQVEWKDVSVYTYRICPGLSHGFGISRPCESCRKYIKDLGIRNIYYTTDDGYVYERLA